MATLHFLRDFLAHGTDNVPRAVSFDNSSPAAPNPELQNLVKQLLSQQGQELTQRLLTGMMYTFPLDCFPDASGVLLAMFQLLPQVTAGWVEQTVQMLPAGSISDQERERLLRNIGQRIESGEVRRIRQLLQDFTNSWRRRNVAPRDGLGRLEAGRFRFSG